MRAQRSIAEVAAVVIPTIETGEQVRTVGVVVGGRSSTAAASGGGGRR